MKNNIDIDKIVPFVEEKLSVKFESLIGKKGVLVRKQNDLGIVLDKTDESSIIIKISDTTTDRSGEVILQDGLNLDDYLKNPIMCWGHDYSIPAIAKITELQKSNNATYAKVKFGSGKTCQDYYNLVKEGILSACSIGFVSTREIVKGTREFVNFIKENSVKYGLSNIENIKKIITESTMLELSLVNIPCNQNALVVMKSLNIEDDLTNKIIKANKWEVKSEGNTETNTPEVVSEAISEAIIESNVVSDVKTEEVEADVNTCIDKGCDEEVVDKPKEDVKEVIDIEKVEKEVEVDISVIENAGGTPEEAFSPTEITPENEIDQVIKEVEPVEEPKEEVKEVEHTEDDNCECEECKIAKQRKAEYDKAKEEESKEETKYIEVVEIKKYWKVLSRPLETLKKEAILKKKGKIK